MKAKQYFDPSPEIIKSLLKLNKRKAFSILEKKIEVQLKKFPNSSFLHNLKGSSLSNQNRLEESLKSFNLALESAKKPEVILNNIGVTEIKLNRFEDAIQTFYQAINLNSSYAEAHYNIAQTLRKLKRTEEAILSYEKAIQINPKYAKAFLFKALAFKNLGNFKESISAAKQALSIQPDYGIAHRLLTSMSTYSDKNKIFRVDKSRHKRSFQISALLHTARQTVG